MEVNSNPPKKMALNSNSNSNPNSFLFQEQGKKQFLTKAIVRENLALKKQNLELRKERLNKEQQELEFLEEQQQQQQQQQPQQQQQQQQQQTEKYKWRDVLPTGYRFKPTDEELLGYLFSKLCDLPIRRGLIADVNVYEYHPSSLTAMAFDAGDGVLYFFTALKRKNLNGMRPIRGTTTGGGYWRTTSKPIDITTSHSIDPNNSEAGLIKIMAIKRSLVYMIGKPSEKGIKTNWIMHEYTIYDVKPSTSQQPNQWNKYIVCSIYHRQARAGDSAELSVLGKRKQQERQIIEPDSETEAEEFVDNEKFIEKLDVDEDNPTKRTRVLFTK